jgi:hypothetical protein
MIQTSRIFLLSPASVRGKRAEQLLNPAARFALAVRLRETGIPIGEAFSFLSGLYFRGKLAYARSFARQKDRVLVLTAGSGLLPPDTVITAADLVEFAAQSIGAADNRYTAALRVDAERAAVSDPDAVILLGSIATGKYVDVLLPIFGERLVFPREFVGRGDMSRGGLMLRSVAENTELTYIPVAGATRRGSRPAKLQPIRR